MQREVDITKQLIQAVGMEYYTKEVIDKAIERLKVEHPDVSVTQIQDEILFEGEDPVLVSKMFHEYTRTIRKEMPFREWLKKQAPPTKPIE